MGKEKNNDILLSQEMWKRNSLEKIYKEYDNKEIIIAIRNESAIDSMFDEQKKVRHIG